MLRKNFWKKNVKKIFLEKHYEKKILKKHYEKKILKKNFGKKISEKSFDKKNVGKINYRTKLFITKIYSNIDKCHIMFALLASFDKNRAKDRE